MSGLTDSQQEVARILFGLPESTGFALAGGSALVALGVIDRPTRDLDAFVAARAGDPSGDVGPLAATFSATLAGAGWDVEAVRQHRTGRSCGNGSPRGASTFDPPGWSGPGPGGTARTGRQTPRTPKPLARRTFRALTRGFDAGTPNGIRTRAATLRATPGPTSTDGDGRRRLQFRGSRDRPNSDEAPRIGAAAGFSRGAGAAPSPAESAPAARRACPLTALVSGDQGTSVTLRLSVRAGLVLRFNERWGPKPPLGCASAFRPA